jgi:hypothetical protein
MEYPHWLMIAGAVLVAFGFVGFAFSQNKNKGESREPLDARNETARSAEEVANLAEQESRRGTPSERLEAMRQFASASADSQRKAKGK